MEHGADDVPADEDVAEVRHRATRPEGVDETGRERQERGGDGDLVAELALVGDAPTPVEVAGNGCDRDDPPEEGVGHPGVDADAEEVEHRPERIEVQQELCHHEGLGQPGIEPAVSHG